MKFRKILVPMDFSGCAINALRIAKKFAIDSDAELLLMTVAHTPQMHVEAMGAAAIVQPMLSDFYEEIDENYKKLRETENLKEVNYSIKKFTSGFFDAINICLEEETIDLIISGTHAEHDMLDSIFGSKSADIIGLSKVPVFVIPENATEIDIKKIGVAINFESNTDFKKLDIVKSFAKFFNAALVVIHIADDSKKLFIYDDDKVALSVYLKETEHTFFTLKEEHDLVEGLLHAIDELNLDILFMYPQSYGMLQGLFHKSKTKTVAMRIDIPLLTMHE